MRASDKLPGRVSVAAHAVSLLLLFAPPSLMGIAAARYDSWLMGAGAIALVFGGLLFARFPRVWRPPISGSVILLYVMAVAWTWLALREIKTDEFIRALRALFLTTAIALFVIHDLFRTGLEPRRRATRLCTRIRFRTHWPAHIEEFYLLPDIHALREAIQIDPGPAIRLLDDARPEVRLAAFISLENRKSWRPGESAAVVDALNRTLEPQVRAAGTRAIGSASDPESVNAIARHLRDASSEVRRAAVEALLLGGNDRWALVRDLVRDALSDPAYASDGAMSGAAGKLPAVAVCDLTAWTCETEPLSARSVKTLIEHYAIVLRSNVQPELPAELASQILDAQTPPVLRLEMAGLFRDLQLMTPELLDRMTNVDQPGPIRLLAAEQLLIQDPNHPDALDVLRGLGRQPNRETALAIAQLLQKYVGVRMGLPDGPVAVNSKIAGEAAKRVLQWATGKTAVGLGGQSLDTTPGPTVQLNPFGAPPRPGMTRPGYGSSQNLRR